eukprot:m.959275 g.959275  ORF g.959275 m.959275 type:complete len:60 (+) comp23882_c0_seq36:1592-1771(+)
MRLTLIHFKRAAPGDISTGNGNKTDCSLSRVLHTAARLADNSNPKCQLHESAKPSIEIE